MTLIHALQVALAHYELPETRERIGKESCERYVQQFLTVLTEIGGN